VFFGKRTVYRFSIFSASERVTYDEKIMRRLRDNFLDRLWQLENIPFGLFLGNRKGTRDVPREVRQQLCVTR